GKTVKAIRNGYRASPVPQVPQLMARINELESEVKEMKETQREMVRFMVSFKAANDCPRGISTHLAQVPIIIVLVEIRHHLVKAPIMMLLVNTRHHLVKRPIILV
nr:hypothetical protein [Tanacetum cinerariifolium]